MPALIALRGLTKVYLEGSRERQVLRGLDAEFGQGEFVAIRGRSGSGKTTLLNLIAGIDLPSSVPTVPQRRSIRLRPMVPLVAEPHKAQPADRTEDA